MPGGARRAVGACAQLPHLEAPGPLYSVIDRRMSWWECLYIVNGALLRWDVVVHRVEMSPVIAVVLAVLAFRFDLLGC